MSGTFYSAFSQRPQPQKKEIVQERLAVEALEYECLEGSTVEVMMIKSFVVQDICLGANADICK